MSESGQLDAEGEDAHGLDAFDAASTFQRLEFMIVASTTAAIDLSPIERFPQLTHLHINITGSEDQDVLIDNLEPLVSLRKLEELHFEYGGINARSAPSDFDGTLWLGDLSPLTRIPGLKRVRLTFTTLRGTPPDKLRGLIELEGH